MESLAELVVAVGVLAGAAWLALRIPADSREEVRRVLRDHLS
jgi:hypothetical protein